MAGLSLIFYIIIAVLLFMKKSNTAPNAGDGIMEFELRAKMGRLPFGFKEWGIIINKHSGDTVAHVAARAGTLPGYFDWWSLSDNNGRTVAHVAAEFRRLPCGFNQWSLADKNGYTVAHEAAKQNCLPKDFCQWGLKNKNGRTVKQEFYYWNLTIEIPSKRSIIDESGWTLAHEEMTNGQLPTWFQDWHLADKDGYTVAHVGAEKGTLPSNFNQWSLADKDGWSVAHAAALSGSLPLEFDQWDLSMNSGWTVDDVYKEKRKTPTIRAPFWRMRLVCMHKESGHRDIP